MGHCITRIHMHRMERLSPNVVVLERKDNTAQLVKDDTWFYIFKTKEGSY